MDKGLEEFLMWLQTKKYWVFSSRKSKIRMGIRRKNKPKTKCKKYMGRVNINITNSSNSWNFMKEYKNRNSFF